VDQDWGDWPDDEQHGDAETADLGDPDEPLASGLGGYGDPGADLGGDGGEQGGDAPGGYPGGGSGPGGFLEDDPMGAFAGGPDDGGPDDGGPDDGGPTDGGDSADGGSEDSIPNLGHDPDAAAGDVDDGGGQDTTSVDPAGEPVDDPVDTSDHAGPETVVGADPDVDPDADWTPADFPDQLDFAAPEPVDGYPWSDPSAVAAPGTGGEDPAAGPDAAPPAQDLLDYAGAEGGADPWSALLGSDDPATSSLGRWWSPDA
jgi:hypothetical protein